MKASRPQFSRTPLIAALAAAGLTATLAPGALAQRGAVLEEIIVSARKVAEAAQDVPVAITAFTGESMEALILRDIREMEGYIPNVVIDSVSVAPGGASLYFRGVGTQEVERSFDPAVGVVIDGVPLSFVNGSMANTFDIAAMEVLRGPQGTLFGRNTTGGVINITHTRPTGELGLRYELVAGTDDRFDARGVLNFPIMEDKLAGKIGFATQQDGGQLENRLTGDQVGDADNTEFTGTLLWTPAENFEALFIYTYYEDQNDGVPLVNRASLNTDNPVNPAPDLPCLLGFCDTGQLDKTEQDFYSDDIDFELDSYSLEFNWELKYGTVTSVTGYRDTNESVPTDFDASPIAFFHTLRNQDSEQTSSELRFATNSDFSERWDFVAGVYWLDDNYQLEQFTSIAEFGGPESAVYQNPHIDHDRETYSIFGEAHISFLEDWTLTLGGRWTDEEKEITADNFLAFGAPEGYFPIGFAKADESWDEFTPKVGVDYRFSEDVLLYATYSEGFRSGGFNGRNYTPETIGPYDPEFVDQYEIGMKGDFLDQTLRFNANVFYTDYDDKQEEVIQPDGFGGSNTVVQNASTVEIGGAEAELTWVASDNFLVTANFGYLDAEYDDYFADLTGDGIATDNSDLELRRVPEWTGGATGTYTRVIGPGMLTVFAAVRYTDEYWVEVANDPRGLLDDRTVIDATISYEWDWSDGKSVRISAFGRDITDEQDYNSAVTIPGTIAFSAVAGGEQYGVQITGNF